MASRSFHRASHSLINIFTLNTAGSRLERDGSLEADGLLGGDVDLLGGLAGVDSDTGSALDNLQEEEEGAKNDIMDMLFEE